MTLAEATVVVLEGFNSPGFPRSEIEDLKREAIGGLRELNHVVIADDMCVSLRQLIEAQSGGRVLATVQS